MVSSSNPTVVPEMLPCVGDQRLARGRTGVRRDSARDRKLPRWTRGVPGSITDRTPRANDVENEQTCHG
jgi:hypothetical protein